MRDFESLAEPQGCVDVGSSYADRSQDRWLVELVGPIGSDSLGRHGNKPGE